MKGEERVGMNKISVYIIAYNQEEKIEPALKSIQWADEIVLADSFSTDRTAEIAEKYGARVVQIPFKGFGDLRNQAIEACSHEWIFSLDSDERCTPEAKEEILSIVHPQDTLESESPGLPELYYTPRKNFFMGKWIRYCGYYPDYRQPQLFKKGTLVFKPDPVHERYDIISKKPAGRMKAAIHQIPYHNLEEMLAKKDRYSTLGAVKLAKEGKRHGMSAALMHGLWSFVRTYILKLGFLDGWPGFVIALGNFEETFYKYAKFHVKMEGLNSPE